MSEQVREMFTDISGKYDLLNDILSFGIHRFWRKKVVKLLDLKRETKVLDLATGTGDLAFEMEKHADKIVGTDFCEGMLDVARIKAKARKSNVQFGFADAMNLEFPDNSFDATTISFGIRNVDNPTKCLSEMARVIKSGGKVCVLEFGQPHGVFSWFYKTYSRYIMPKLGKIFAGNASPYTYLPQTAAKFPCGDKFIEIMRSTNAFTSSKAYKLTFGIAYIYIGVVK